MRLSAAILFVFTVSASTLRGQAIRCPAGQQKNALAECVMKRAGLVEQIPIIVEGANGKPLANARVRFTAVQVGTIDTTLTTDTLGAVTAIWRGPANLKDEDVQIKVEASSNTAAGRFAPMTVLLKKLPAPPPPPDSIGILAGDHQAWYAGRQLPRRIKLQVFGPSKADCSNAVVTFKPMGGSEITPDSARASWEDHRCEVQAWWKLSGTVGEQLARASLGNTNPIFLRAHSRKEPWLAAGLAVTKTGRYRHLAVSSQTIQVVTKSASAETTFTVPRQSGKLEELGGRVGFTPTLGINTPLFTSWRRVRVSISADAQHLTTDWFAGISLPQLRHSVWSEEMGVDLQLIAHVSRRDVVTNAEACASNIATCVSETRTSYVGYGLAAQLNASSALAAIVGLFPK